MRSSLTPKAWIPWVLFSAVLTACTPQSPTTDAITRDTRERAEAFFQVYADRSDFETFLDFYAEDAVVEDIVNGDLIDGRDAIRAFFDWSNPRVVRAHDQALVLSSLVVEGRSAVARGHFTEFHYDGQPLGPWRFMIVLEFGADGKIRRQEDFINYPDALLDPERTSSNERI